MARANLLAKYDDANRCAAELIIVNPDRYAGLPLLWARLFFERWTVEQRDLIERSA